MKIFLDTNVFYNNWFMKSANFKYLFHFLNNEHHELILSKLVIQETENLRNRELDGYLSEIQRNVKKAQKLKLDHISFNIENAKIEEYDLLSLVKERVDYVEEIDYEDIAHSEVVNRALHSKKPFMAEEKGYRDTLIWLSFLNYLIKENTEEEVIFITENKSDFFKGKDKAISFHQDLDNDIKQKKVVANITPYKSLFDFVNKTIDKDVHAIDKFNSDEIFEPFIEESGSEFLEAMSNIDLALYFNNSIFENEVRTISDIRAEVFEGLEDPEFLHTKIMDNNNVYVSYRYNLRIVVLEIDVPEIDYTLNKGELDKIFSNIEVNSDIATLSCCIRPYYDVSFIYNTRDETFKDYEVANLSIKQ